MKTPYTYDKGVHGIFDANDNQIADINCSFEIANEIIRACNAHDDLLAACKEFVRRVECGEAKSTRSYNQMKAAIAKAEGK